MSSFSCRVIDAINAIGDGLLWVVTLPFYLGIAVLRLSAWVAFWGTVCFVTYGILWQGNTLKVHVGDGKVEIGTVSHEPKSSVEELKEWFVKNLSNAGLQ